MEMQMLSERGVNIHIYPIIQKRGRVFEGEHIKKNKGEIVFKATQESRWNLRCYKFMDYLSSRLRYAFEETMLRLNPNMGLIKSISDPRLESFVLLMRPDLIHNIIEGITTPYGQYRGISAPYVHTPRISIKNVAKDLKWMKSDVIQTIKMISNYKFKTKYNFLTAKLYGNTLQKNYSHFYDNSMGDFESIFNTEFFDDESECMIKFNTGFGVCFLHNIYVGGYQLIEKELYSLSESSQILYRKRFFPYNTLPKVYLGIDQVLHIIGISSKNKTTERNVFNRIINELIEKTNVSLVEKMCENRYLLSRGVTKKSKDDKKDNVIPIGKYIPYDDLSDIEKVEYSTKEWFDPNFKLWYES